VGGDGASSRVVMEEETDNAGGAAAKGPVMTPLPVEAPSSIEISESFSWEKSQSEGGG
jgi:hypothetical protein